MHANIATAELGEQSVLLGAQQFVDEGQHDRALDREVAQREETLVGVAGRMGAVPPAHRPGGDERRQHRALHEFEERTPARRVCSSAHPAHRPAGVEPPSPRTLRKSVGSTVTSSSRKQQPLTPGSRAMSTLRAEPGFARAIRATGARENRAATMEGTSESASETTSTSNAGGSTCTCRLARHASRSGARRPVTMQTEINGAKSSPFGAWPDAGIGTLLGHRHG